MKRQRQANTTPEILTRQIVHRLGHRFRLRNTDLPGTPDLANRTRRWAIFVHGCYWHAHRGCHRATVPKRNRQFWLEKFEDNRRRDRRKQRQLRELGYTVLTVWECETKEPTFLVRKLRRDLPRP
jgi:DNA mismatch endonuclease (patch repair protein)